MVVDDCGGVRAMSMVSDVLDVFFDRFWTMLDDFG